MDARYSRVLKRIAGRCVGEVLPDFHRYVASRMEARIFLAGSQFFRKMVLQHSYVYIVISPASGAESAFVVLLGWGFGESLEEHNYLEQFREMGGNIWPTSRYRAGFEQLQVLEGSAAAWGEVLPSVDLWPEGEDGSVEHIEKVLRDALVGALLRSRTLLGRFAAAIEDASPL